MYAFKRHKHVESKFNNSMKLIYLLINDGDFSKVIQ